MSQISKISLGSGSGNRVIIKINTDSGTAEASANNLLFALGGTNINTSGASNVVTINLDADMVLNSAQAELTNLVTPNSTRQASYVAPNRIQLQNGIPTPVTGNQIYQTAGTGKVIYDSDIPAYSTLYWDNLNRLNGKRLLDGEMLITGDTNEDMVGAALTGGSGITITNSANNSTISNAGMLSGSAGFSSYSLISWEDYNQETTLEMTPNTGYIINWNTSSSGPFLNLTFPEPSGLSVGDSFYVAILNAYGDPDSSLASVYIDPSVNNYGIQSPYQRNDLNNFDISARIRPITKNGGKPTVIFTYVGNEGNNVGNNRNIFQVLKIFGSWRWDTVS